MEVNYQDCVEEDFTMQIDLDLEKAVDSKPWIIKGIASTEIADLDDEILIVKGMDISYLTEDGILNWHHGKGANSIVGEITKAEKYLEKKPAELYVEGFLYKDQPEAQGVHKLMKALESSPTGRKMKMSVEGKALVREGKKIVKSRMTAVALTMQPINKASYAVLAKGMCQHPESNVCLLCSSTCIAKALEAETSGKPLIKQSLRGRVKCDNCLCEGGECKNKKNRMQVGVMSKAETLSLIKSRWGCSDGLAQRALELIIQ